jgi:hypothetical protein
MGKNEGKPSCKIYLVERFSGTRQSSEVAPQ